MDGVERLLIGWEIGAFPAQPQSLDVRGIISATIVNQWKPCWDGDVELSERLARGRSLQHAGEQREFPIPHGWHKLVACDGIIGFQVRVTMQP